WTTFRVSSEIAVAIKVASPGEKPRLSARARPRSRAVTMSASERIGEGGSWSPSSPLRPLEDGLRLDPAIQVRQPFLEVEIRRDAFEREPELRHREGDLRLYSDDHRLRAAEPDHVRHVAQGPRGEGIEKIERGDVENDAARAAPPHPLDQRVAQLE